MFSVTSGEELAARIPIVFLATELKTHACTSFDCYAEWSLIR